VPGGWALPACYAAGSENPSPQAAGSAILVSRNGGLTWSQKQAFGYGGGYGTNSISCADASHCWVAWSGTDNALDGTADAGVSWSTVTSDTSSEFGMISCLSVKVCVATTDNGLWVTDDDGGL